MKKPSFAVLITGAPATGKTTLGKVLAKRLSIPFIDKDDILETLFDSLGIGDQDWRWRLSRASDTLFLKQLKNTEKCIAVSYWRHPHSQRKASGTPVDWCSKAEQQLIEVHCFCKPETATTRFKARRRHAGHLDEVEQELRYMKDDDISQQVGLGPLGVGQLIAADTDKSLDILSVEIAKQIENLVT